jgi:hypothetical protein
MLDVGPLAVGGKQESSKLKANELPQRSLRTLRGKIEK